MLLCMKCHIEYEDGKKLCSSCGSPLVTKEKAVSCEEDKNKTKEEKPIGKLICPNCKILYEKMTSCIKCGATLVKQIPSQEREEPKPSYTPEVKKEELKAAYSPEVKKEKLKPIYSPEVKKEPPQVQTPKKRPTEKLPEDIGRRVSPPGKSKKNFLRLPFQGFRIFILIGVAIYLLWSMYSYLTTKQSKPSAPTSKEVIGPILPSTSAPTNHTSKVTEPKKNQKKQPAQSSSISKVATDTIPSSSIPITSKVPTAEGQEKEGIRGLLEKIRQANLQKNINIFMACYSTDFKDREGKKRTTLESWGNFNYLDLSYNLKRHSISGNTANARVEWLMRISPKIGGQSWESKTVLDVTFRREDGSWKIKEIKPVI